MKENKISQPMFKVKAEKNVSIQMRDGIRLVADIYRPDAGGRFPALLAMCPYCKDIQAVPIPPQPPTSPLWAGYLEAGNSEYFVTRGYVHVIADLRGTGQSEGKYRDLFSKKEQEDGYDLVEWIAQQDWCNGNVGLVGISYFACIQYLVAAQQPPHLKAIFPLDGWGDLYRDIVYHGGILNVGFFSPFLWTEIAATDSVAAMFEMASPEEVARLVQEAKKNRDIEINPWLSFVLSNPQKNPILFDYLVNPNDGPFYWERSGYTYYGKIKVPTYCGSRWNAYYFHLPGALSCYLGIDAPKKLIITPPKSYERPWHEYHDVVVRWFDHWLKGIDTGIMDEPPIKIFVQGVNQWRYEEEWPLKRTKWTKFYLASRERLLPQNGFDHGAPPHPDEPDCFLHQSPATTNHIQSVKYLTPPLSEETEVTGPIALYLYASIDTADTNWIVTLKDVDEHGLETKLTEGWLKASHRVLDESKSEPWQPYHPHRNPEPVKPGEVCQYAIVIQPTSNVFKAGHRIGLEITSSDYSGTYLHMDTPYLHHLPSSKITFHEIYHTEKYPSHLLLPVIPKSR